MGEEQRAAKCIVTANGLRARVRALLACLPPDVLSRPDVADLRHRLAAHVERRNHEPREGTVIERELRDLVELAGRLATACWSHHEAGGRLGASVVQVRKSVTLARCLIDRRTSLPPPMPK